MVPLPDKSGRYKIQVSKIHSLNFGKADRPPRTFARNLLRKTQEAGIAPRCLPLETIGFRTHLYRGGMFYSGK